ncbi:hypothetical protein B4U80_05675 [Leptotrombidium deliense]|uniref:Uncharacterized protein n=1 Tax=Leptotrombidium deliense TaxID=299467 RepID=A0A443SFH3_9ACAR|nr:hypothetical protein B4U80_05675 [Leptotrombidium deliense]
MLNITDVRLGAAIIIEYFNLPLSENEFYEKVMHEFDELRNNLPLMPGVEKLVLHLHENKIPIGICSATDSNSFKQKTEHFGDFFKLGKYFEVIVTAKDDPEIKRNKPFSDPYLAAISRFKSKPNANEVLSFEDSSDGVKSATNAGTVCVLIRNPEIEYDFSILKPTVIIDSLTDFDPRWFSLPAY